VPDKLSLSGEELSLSSIDDHHRDVESSLRYYFSTPSPGYAARFLGYTPAEVIEELYERLAEAELAALFTLLASVEAAFRIDFLQRCYRKDKADISRHFRELNRRRPSRIKLDEDIFDSWANDIDALRSITNKLKAAFQFRHWLAHGRYWTPKFGRKFDYLYLYQLADEVFQNFPILRSP
jgi:hypothetical protein